MLEMLLMSSFRRNDQYLACRLNFSILVVYFFGDFLFCLVFSDYLSDFIDLHVFKVWDSEVGCVKNVEINFWTPLRGYGIILESQNAKKNKFFSKVCFLFG